MKITATQMFIYKDPETNQITYSVNFAVDDKWMIQRGNDARYSIPRSDEAMWNYPASQDRATRFDADKVAELLDLPWSIAPTSISAADQIAVIIDRYSPDIIQGGEYV